MGLTINPELAAAVAAEAWQLSLAPYSVRQSGGQWQAYRWLASVARYVTERVLEGDARIILSVPPRHGKSEMISHRLPVWVLNLNPEARIIGTSYADSLASVWGRKVRDTIEGDPRHRAHIRHDMSSVSDWQTTAGGGMRCAGVGAGVTGRGGDLLIADDLHKDWADAHSETILESTWQWFTSTFMTRREPGGSVVLVMTRWHQADTAGRLKDEHPDDWEVIRLPALAEDGDPLGRAPGEALCPERFTAADLQRIRDTDLTPDQWAGLYQQRPDVPGGTIVREDWIQYYDALPDKITRACVSWDFSFKKSGSSFVVGSLWAEVRRPDGGRDYYLVDQVRGRMGFVETQQAVIGFRGRSELHRKARPLFEEAANGNAIEDSLGMKVPGLLMVRPDKSKIARLSAVAPLFKTGNVYAPRPSRAAWVKEWVRELTRFPNYKTNDQVDSASMALAWLSGRRKLIFRMGGRDLLAGGGVEDEAGTGTEH